MGSNNIRRSFSRSFVFVTVAAAGVGLSWATGGGCGDETKVNSVTTACADAGTDAGTLPSGPVQEGKQTFRFDTFGDEVFWGDALKLHQAIAGAANGGVGAGVSPTAALQLGLKVDAAALPPEIVDGIQKGTVDLNDPATTLALMKLNAVVGITGFFDNAGTIKSMGIQCALCHSTVDDSFAPGIGQRLDGWANRDLNVGAIIAAAPDLSSVAHLLGVDEAAVRTVVNAWGPGKFDAELLMDGKGFRPDGKTAATLIPPAFGLAGINLHTWTGWGSVPHWNAFVAVLEMHGVGNFYDPRLDDPVRFPIAAANRFGHVVVPPEKDRVTSKLPGLHAYQLSLAAPTPPPDSFDKEAAARGATLFEGKAKCVGCHTAPLMTEPGWNMHKAAEIGVDDFQAQRAPDGQYRTAPLHGLYSHTKGGFYHDGRFATLADVVNHYDALLDLGLDGNEKNDLVEYLDSI